MKHVTVSGFSNDCFTGDDGRGLRFLSLKFDFFVMGRETGWHPVSYLQKQELWDGHIGLA